MEVKYQVEYNGDTQTEFSIKNWKPTRRQSKTIWNTQKTKPVMKSQYTHPHIHTLSDYQAFRGLDVGEVNQLEVGWLRNQRVRWHTNDVFAHLRQSFALQRGRKRTSKWKRRSRVTKQGAHQEDRDGNKNDDGGRSCFLMHATEASLQMLIQWLQTEAGGRRCKHGAVLHYCRLLKHLEAIKDPKTFPLIPQWISICADGFIYPPSLKYLCPHQCCGGGFNLCCVKHWKNKHIYY